MAGIWDAVNNNLFNPEKPNAPGVLSDVRRASGQFASGLGSTLRDVGLEDTGGALESYGAGVVRRNPSEIQSFQDVLSRPFTTAREAVGEIVPQVGLAVGGQLAGRAIGGFLGTPLGPLGIIGGQQLGGLVGGLAPIVAQTYGGIRSEQREAGIDDRPRALGATIPAAALERFGGAERIAGKIAGQGTQFLAREAGESLWGALSRQALRGGVEETITEIPQTALERYGAYKTLTGPEAFDEYGVAGAKAFLGGGAVRAGLSAVAGTRPAQGEIDLTQPETPIPPAQAPTGLDISATTPAAQPTTTSLVSQETDLTAPADISTAEVTTPVATTTTSAAAPTDLTATTTEAADTTPSIFSKTDEELNELSIKPTKKSRSIYNYMVSKGINPKSEEAEPILNALSENKFKFATDTIGAIIRARSPRGAAVSTVQQPAGSVGVGGAVVPGTLGAAGSDASLAGAVGGGAATTGAPLQQVGLLPNTAGQPSTTVTPLTRGAVTPEKVSALTDDQLKTELTNVDLSDAEYGLVKAEQTRRQEKTPIKPNTTLRLVQQEALPDQDTAVDDYVEIARATGNTGGINATLADAAGKRQDQKNFTKVELNEVIESQLADSSNKDRDRKIIQAYITARRAVPRGDRVKMQKEIGATFGVDASRVRQIGNPEKLANVAVAMGFDRNQVFTELGIQSTKEAAVDLTQANEAVGEGGIVESENQVISDTAESDVEELADDSREWQKASTAGSQMAVQLVSLADKIAELKVAADELKQFGLPEAEAAAAKRINELTERYTALTTKLTAAKKVPKPTKQPPSTEAAQKAAEEVDMFKEAAKEAEAAKFRAERAAKLAADRKGLEVGDTVMNPKLGTGVVKGFSGDGDATIVTVDFKSGQTKELSVKMAKLEKTNAVQVKSTASVPVQPKTEAGQGVGKQVRRAEKPASQGEIQVLTNSEQAAQAWDKVASGYPTAPKFADLTKAQQQNFIGFGPDNWTEEDVNTELTKLAKSGLKFGKDRVASQPYTAEELTAEIKDFVRADIPDRKLIIVDSIDDLLNSGTPAVRELGEAIEKKGAYGVAQGGVAYLVANRIQKGQGRAKFMHEVGAHLGLENLLPTAVYDKLVDQLETWAESGKDSLEAQLAAKAKARVGYAKTPTVDEREELLAYFVEEAMLAGVDPTASTKESGPLMAWFRTLWAAFKVAVRRLGFKPETLRAQDIVNMAFGAARLEMNGSWHGTAATFRRFNHAFMNSGEGAQAYGWGTYLAQAVGIGKGYWEADINRKHQSTVENTLKQYVGWRFAESVVHPIDREEIAYAGSQLKIAKDLVEAVYMNPAEFATPGYLARRFLEVGVDSIKLVSPTGEKKTIRLGAPEGSLMRLDTAVPTSEMIDWDASFAEQPKVVTDFIKKEAPNIKVLRDQGVNIQITSGAGIVKYLTARFYKEGGYKGSWKDADPAIKMAVKEQASKYLEANGIQGIQFYDANSRENTLDNVSFTKNGKTVKGRTGVLQAYFTPGAIVQGYGGPDKVIKFDPVKELITVIAVDNNGNPRRGERERTHFTIPSIEDVGVAMQQRGYDIGASNRTRNLVIFNEKNIFRAGSEAAADKQRMKFGFGGVEATGAKTFERRIELVQAQLDTANGVDPETIWKETGWYKGTDNKWRFEFDDSQAKFKQDFKDIDLYTELKLSDVLDHPELFAQYPELKDVTFEKRKVMMDVWGSTQGWFDPKTKKLVVTPYARDPLSTVLHEVQHWIQSKEKFENGSSPQGSDLSNKAALTKLRNELQKAIDAYDASELESQARKARGERYSSNFDKFVEKNRAADLMGAVDALLANTAELAPMYSKVRALDSEVTRLETAKGVLEKKFKEENKKVNVLKRVANYAEQMKEIRFYSDKIKTISDEHYAANKELKARVVELTDGKDVAHELYRLVAGEAEARNVQSRMGMSFEERVKSFPAATMDVSPENTLTSTGRGGAYLSQERMKFGVNAPTQGTIQRNIAKLPKPLQKSAREQWTNISTLAKRGLYASAITEDVIGLATKYMPSAAKYLQAQYERQGTRLEFERRIEDILGAFEKLPENLKGVGKGSVNEYIQDSTVQKKWGYYPGEQQIGTTLFETDPDLEERFKAFPPAAQKVIKDVFRHGYEALRLKQKAAESAVNREFEAREKAAGNDLDMLQSLAKEKAQMLRRMTRLRNVEVSEPYAYLGRYGDYVVVAKSKEFIAYEEAAKGTEARVGADSITGDAQQAKNWLQDNVSNPLHYVVQFAETQGEADSIAADLQATGQYDIQPEDAGIKEASASYAGGYDVHMAVARLRNLANRQSESTDTKLDKAISDLYLMTVAEASARRSELERKNVSGADKNMMRNLATSGRADAHFLANMEHGDAINDALETMRNQARNNRKEAMPLYNELYTRYADSMEYSQPSVLAQNMLRMSTLWHLSTSPAYYLQQALQTSVLSLPYMAGRLGYARSASAIKRAYGDMSDLVSGLGVSDRIDFDKAPADVRFMLKELVRMGKIDIGVDADATARIDDKGPLGKAMFKLQNVNARIEAINRATAAIAAYRGYVDLYKNAPGADGVKFAADVVSNSHGNYDGFNTPRIMQSGGAKVLLQFKRFQIIQLSMLAKLIHTSFKGASAEERAIARASLKYITAHMAVLGGALGVPFVSQAASILSSVFGDEDEPDDYEYKLRRMIGDGAVADLLLRGVPAALGLESIGKRLAMENVASPFGPFVEFNLTSRADAAQMIVGMMGPSVGLGLKFVDALGMMSKGEYYKGLELALPNGIANLMKGYRFGTEGITMRNGDLVLKPEDISLIDTAFQAVGLPTTTITDRQYTQKVVAEFDKFYSQRAGEIKSSYLKASRQSDAAAMADARTSWQELQDSRAKNGYKRQPLSELLRVPAEARKRERGVVGGVETTKSNRRFVEQVSSVS